MESHLCLALWICGGRAQKGTLASACLSVWEKAAPQFWLLCQILKFLPICLSNCYPGAGAQREWVWVSPCLGFLRVTAWDSRSVFHWLNPHWFLHPEIMGTYLSGTGSLGWGARCGAGVPCSQNVPPQFLPATRVCGTSPFCFSVPPTIVNGCGFFNSIVVSLPFNSILDSSEWRLFYSLAAILMWLCKEVSHVYLCCHLDWMSYRPFIG